MKTPIAQETSQKREQQESKGQEVCCETLEMAA